MLQKESNKEHNKPVDGPNLLMSTNDPLINRKDSCSDGSMCELRPLTKAAYTKYQQINNQKQDYILPACRTNRQSRKRYSSNCDRDQAASSGYETSSKKSKQDSTESLVIKTSNPVMENRVSSTNRNVGYKCMGPTPAEKQQVSYTLEEKVRIAAFAIVYNNCKICTEKFEALSDKPAPDFKTIFDLRHRLLTTGCLVDPHLELEKEKVNADKLKQNSLNAVTSKTKTVSKVRNPDELIIPSDSEEDDLKNSNQLRRSISAETLCIGADVELQTWGDSATTNEDRQTRSHSQSTNRRTRLNSHDSQDSNYPDTDSEKCTKTVKPCNVLKPANIMTRQTIHDTDSDSVSYNSDEDNFLSRVFGENKKKRKVKRRPVSATIPKANSAHSDVNTFEGYSTIKITEKSPLATGNIYTSNLRNMNVKIREHVDVDGYSSEYVPTKLGSIAKNNYQDFKDNVRKKGYWAKGNGASYIMNKRSVDTNRKQRGTARPSKQVTKSASTADNKYATPKPDIKPAEDFASGDLAIFTDNEQYISFDEPEEVNRLQNLSENASESTNRIFAVVQSNNTTKNRSILDIFDTSDPLEKSPQLNNDLEKYDTLRKQYENKWDEDDDALYGESNCGDIQATQLQASSQPCTIKIQSPTSKLFRQTKTDGNLLDTCNMNNMPDFIKEKHEIILDMLKDLQNNEISQMVSPLKHGSSHLQSSGERNLNSNDTTDITPNFVATQPDKVKIHPKTKPLPAPKMIETSPHSKITKYDSSPSPTKSKLNTNRNQVDQSPKCPVNRPRQGSKITKSPTQPISNPHLPRSNVHRKKNQNKYLNRSQDVANPPITRSYSIQNLPTAEPNIKINSLDQNYQDSTNQELSRFDKTQNAKMTRSDSISCLNSTNTNDSDHQLPNYCPKQFPNTPMIGPSRNLNFSDRHNSNANIKNNKSVTTSALNTIRPDLVPNVPANRPRRIPDIPLPRSELVPNPMLSQAVTKPTEHSNEVFQISEETDDSNNLNNTKKIISPSKKVRVLEYVTLKAASEAQSLVSPQKQFQHSTPKQVPQNTKPVPSSPSFKKNEIEENPVEHEQSVTQADLSNLLAGINTNTLLLALQNLQQMTQKPSTVNNTEGINSVQQNCVEQASASETINLTNDEDWEKESNRDGSIERELEKLHGRPTDTPFLSDIFDPGPVIIPPNIVRKLNLNADTEEESKMNENDNVIGNFKSFALPKPILLNRLKLTVKTSDKPAKGSGKREKRKKKVCTLLINFSVMKNQVRTFILELWFIHYFGSFFCTMFVLQS